jgi:hypothetical protein
MDRELAPVNPTVRRNFPDALIEPLSFAEFSNVRRIVDCTELRIEQPQLPDRQNATCSNYKRDSTVKFLIAALPTGGICFVSRAVEEEEASNRQIVEQCGFLDMVNPGDLIMADQEFNISDLLGKKYAHLQICPSLSNEQQQLQFSNATLDITYIRLHIKRALDRVKQFHILDPVVSLSLYATISSVFRVCCFLSNLKPPMTE